MVTSGRGSGIVGTMCKASSTPSNTCSSPPLLKRVAGLPGDPVCASPDAVRVAGRVARILAADRRGTALLDSATSFDSRYFGPVRIADVRGPYREVLEPA